MRAQRVVAEGVGIPLRQHHDGLLGPRGVLVRGRRIPARIHQVVFGIRRALGRGEAQKLRRRSLALGRLLLDRRVLGQRFRADVGGEQLRMPLFQPEVGGPLVAKEDVAVADEQLVDAHHGGFGGGIVAHTLRAAERPRRIRAPQERARSTRSPTPAAAPRDFRRAWSAASPTLYIQRA